MCSLYQAAATLTSNAQDHDTVLCITNGMNFTYRNTAVCHLCVVLVFLLTMLHWQPCVQLLAWALAFGACLGGNATIIGASANIVTVTLLDRQGYHVTFWQWAKIGIPVTLVTVVVANVYMLLRYATPGQ